MVQTPTAVCLVAAVATGLFLYSVKHSMTEMDRGIAHAFQATKAANQRSALLRAEWSDLTAPQRLEQAAGQYTTLRPIPPAQYVSLDDLPAHLPAPGSIVPDAPPPGPTSPGTEPPDPAALAALSAAPQPVGAATEAPLPPAATVAAAPARPSEPATSLGQRAPSAAPAHATPHLSTHPPAELVARAAPPRTYTGSALAIGAALPPPVPLGPG